MRRRGGGWGRKYKCRDWDFRVDLSVRSWGRGNKVFRGKIVVLFVGTKEILEIWVG